MGSKITTFNFPNLEMTWEGMQEFLANNELEIIKEELGGVYGTEMVIYNTAIHVERARIGSNFNFGANLGYTIKKWSKLVNNYINFDYLDLVKSEILSREKKKATSYNYLVRFDNSHGSGKDCLISLQFQRRLDDDYPTVIFTTRASEATKRMIFDFLLIQRMVEYVYGKQQIVKAILFIPFMYINVEAFLIYLKYKGGPNEVLLPDEKGNLSGFQTRVKKRYEEFSTRNPKEIKYKVHKKSALQIQGLVGAKDLLAKDLKLERELKITPRNLEKLNKGITI